PVLEFVTLRSTLDGRVPGDSSLNRAVSASNLSLPDSDRHKRYARRVRREFSSRGVLLRRLRGPWMMAAVQPGGKKEGVWALPKGLIGPGEDPATTALREVEEETGAHGRLERKLGDIRYVYTWGGERVFKVVSFYLVRYSGGRLGELPPETAHEVDEVRWLELEDAPTPLSSKCAQAMARNSITPA